VAWSVSVQVRRNLLPGMDARLHKYIAGVTAESAGAIQAGARARVPVDTGALYQGVEVVPADDTHYTVRSTRDVAGDDPAVPEFVEFGTRKMAARPYFTPAVEAERPQFNADTRALEGALMGGGAANRVQRAARGRG
jgi:hypothetical protein